MAEANPETETPEATPKKKTGRPQKTDATKKDKIISFRLTPAEFEKITDAAKAADITPQDYARQAALKGTVRIIQDKRKTDPALITHLLAIGNNLNQMAKKYNATCTAPAPAALETALTELRGLLTQAGENYGAKS